MLIDFTLSRKARDHLTRLGNAVHGTHDREKRRLSELCCKTYFA